MITTISQLLTQANPITLPLLRNWHDRMMKFNKGRGFVVAYLVVPADIEDCIVHEAKYVNGQLQGKLLKGMADKFRNFTGDVEGLLNLETQEFRAVSFADLESKRTSASAYDEVYRSLSQAGFSCIPILSVGYNGWNNLHAVVLGTCVMESTNVVVFPLQPRLLENAATQGLQYGVQVENPHAKDVEVEELSTSLRFVVSGRFGDADKDEAIFDKIKAARHEIVEFEEGEVDVVLVLSDNSQTAAAKYARKSDNVTLLTLKDLESFLEQHK